MAEYVAATARVSVAGKEGGAGLDEKRLIK
jgi:hypothetical protein